MNKNKIFILPVISILKTVEGCRPVPLFLLMYHLLTRDTIWDIMVRDRVIQGLAYRILFTPTSCRWQYSATVSPSGLQEFFIFFYLGLVCTSLTVMLAQMRQSYKSWCLCGSWLCSQMSDTNLPLPCDSSKKQVWPSFLGYASLVGHRNALLWPRINWQWAKALWRMATQSPSWL